MGPCPTLPYLALPSLFVSLPLTIRYSSFFLTASFKILRAGHGEKLSNPSWEKILLAGVVIVNLIKEMLHQTKSADCVAMLKFLFLGQVASFLGEIVLRLCCRTTLQ